MDIKQVTIMGIVFIVIQSLISCGIFVTFSDMQAYAAPKEAMMNIYTQLNRIETKIDKLIIGN